jgi:hypothetical protein
MCEILIFNCWFFLIFTHFSGAVQTLHRIAPVNLRLYPLSNVFNIYFCTEKNAINAYLSTTCPLLTLTMTNQTADSCLQLVHHYLSTTCLSDTVVRYSVTSQTTNCLSTTCPPLSVHHLPFRSYSEIFGDLSKYRLPVHYLFTTCPLLVHKILQ